MANREQALKKYILQIKDTIYDLGDVMNDPDMKQLEEEAKKEYLEGEQLPSRNPSFEELERNRIVDKLLTMLDKIKEIDGEDGPDWLREEMAEKGIQFDFDIQADRDAWKNAVEDYYCQVAVQTLEVWRKDWNSDWSIADELLED